MSNLKTKLAKLLRLHQQSSNANEAANAGRLLNRLCAEHGLDPESVKDYEEGTMWILGDAFLRLDYASGLLLNAVSEFYGGKMVVSRTVSRESYFKIYSSEGSRIRIEVYYEYLSEVMETLADKSKRENPRSPRNWRNNFRKAFADEVGNRLAEIRGDKGTDQCVSDLMAKNCGKVRGQKTRIGSGAEAGREAASKVGLGEQVKGVRVRALSGRM